MSLRDPRRDDWRIQRFHDEIAEERAARRRAQAVRNAMWVGVVVGVVGSFAFYL